MRKLNTFPPNSTFALIAATSFGFGIVFSASGNADAATDPVVRGLEIAQEIDRRGNDGFGDIAVEAVMVLRDTRGRESVRDLKIKVLEEPGRGDKTLTVFDRPRDVKNTALLTWSHKAKDDDQWLYLPAVKRVKRISSSNKSGPFMGSEFAYEDFSSQEVEKYTYRYLRDDQVNGSPVYVVERIPVDTNSGYARQIVWADQSEYRIIKTDFYDRKNVLLKTLVASGYQLYMDRYWRPGQLVMTNHQTQKVTLLTWSEYRFRTGLTANDFKQASLKRGR